MSPDADRLVPLLPRAVAAANARDGRAVILNGRPFGLPDTVRVATAATRDGRDRHRRGRLRPGGRERGDADPGALSAPAAAGPARRGELADPGSTWPITELRRGAQDVTRTGRPRPSRCPRPAQVRNLALTLNDMLSRLGAAQERQRGLISDTATSCAARSPGSGLG